MGGRKLRKSQKSLARRIKSWEESCRGTGKNQGINVEAHKNFKRPGSMKK